MSNSSGDVGDHDPELWSPDDATLLTCLEHVDTSAAKFVDEPGAEDPSLEKCESEKKGVHQFVPDFVARRAQTKTPETVNEALRSREKLSGKQQWQQN